MNNTDFASKKLKGRDVSAAPRINNYNQKGRSMIEMLGVLAIIGVLSVGGIAGYSKAMMRYRVNKTIEQIALIAGNFRSFFASQPAHKRYESMKNSSVSNLNIIRKAKLLPDELVFSEGQAVGSGHDFSYLVNVFGGSIYIQPSCIKSDDGANGHCDNPYEGLEIIFEYIPQEACIDIASQDWSDLTPVGICINISSSDHCSDLTSSVEDAISKCNQEYNDLFFVIK